MPVKKIEFAELEQALSEAGKSVIDFLAAELGKVYVVTVTRDGCPSCEKFKPRIDKVARVTAEKHGNKVVFVQVHIRYSPGKDQESLRSKSVFGHYFYPTSLILIRTGDRGAIEYYRNVSPAISELRKNIEAALQIATFLKKEQK